MNFRGDITMKIIISQSAEELGCKAAAIVSESLKSAIQKNGIAYLLVSTGMSQFTTFEALLKEDIDWTKVEMFHLDEYINLPETHPASFIKYLKERFTNHVPLKKAHFVDPSIGVEAIIQKLTTELRDKIIDIGLIGIGENTHIAFNDPPADFEDDAAFKVVKLDEACRQQQYGEGWFPTLEDVPTTAITITVSQIMKCKCIVSAVPYKAKAEAIYKTLTATESTPKIPASILRTHPNATLLIDKESSALVNDSIIDKASL